VGEPGISDMSRRFIQAMLGVGVLLVAMLPAGARGAERWTLRGAGWGHGVGMSQWGAYGFARKGRSYREVLGHYYTGTRVARGGKSVVRVLLQANRSSVVFTGANRTSGRRLKQQSVYKATREGGTVVLRSGSGRRLATFTDVLPVSGGPTFRLLGQAGNGVRNGVYRGSLEIRVAAGFGLNAINTVGMESYLAGVVPAESPPIWPAEALRAQAVAARSYASSTGVAGRGFDQYPDTRSQVYRGVTAETPSTNSAVAATSGEVVTYNGNVVVTYFFSTSGGYTENVENVFFASAPKPWLKGVPDPYDDSSPHHRWRPISWSPATLSAKLGNLVRGRFRGIDVIQRGVSPRVVRAYVIGSRGRRTATGPQLRARLGLRDTWFFIRQVRTETSGARARTASGSRRLTAIHGSVAPIRARFVELQRRAGDGWKTIEKIPLKQRRRTADYRFHVAESGIYRILAGWAPGPPITVR
jgi:stage II sporulation protein D